MKLGTVKLKDYVYNYIKCVYVNYHLKNIVSMDYAEANTDIPSNDSCEWEFFFIGTLSDSVKKEIIAEIAK